MLHISNFKKTVGLSSFLFQTPTLNFKWQEGEKESFIGSFIAWVAINKEGRWHPCIFYMDENGNSEVLFYFQKNIGFIKSILNIRLQVSQKINTYKPLTNFNSFRTSYYKTYQKAKKYFKNCDFLFMLSD